MVSKSGKPQHDVKWPRLMLPTPVNTKALRRSVAEKT